MDLVLRIQIVRRFGCQHLGVRAAYALRGLQARMKTSFQNLFKDNTKVTELFGLKPEFFRKLTNYDFVQPEDIIEMANNGDFIELINWVK
jgi:hypothetical protein